MSDFRREIRWEPRGGYGIRARFLLHGPLGATQFVVEFRHKPYGDALLDRSMIEGWDVGFHSAQPIDYSTEMEECDVLEQGHCWYDGSGLQAEELAEQFIQTGDAVVWEWLEERYQSWLVGGAAE